MMRPVMIMILHPADVYFRTLLWHRIDIFWKWWTSVREIALFIKVISEYIQSWMKGDGNKSLICSTFFSIKTNCVSTSNRKARRIKERQQYISKVLHIKWILYKRFNFISDIKWYMCGCWFKYGLCLNVLSYTWSGMSAYILFSSWFSFPSSSTITSVEKCSSGMDS